MKKITVLLLFLLYCSANYGQQKVGQKIEKLVAHHTPFRHFKPLLPNQAPLSPEINKLVRNATSLTVNKMVMQDIATNKYSYIEIDVPYNGTAITVQLYRVEVKTKEFHIDTPNAKNIPYNHGAHYRGIVKGDSTSLVSFNFFEKELNGVVSADGINNLVIGHLENDLSVSSYIAYSDSQLVTPLPFKCGVSAQEHVDTVLPAPPVPAPNSGCQRISLEVSHSMCLAKNSDTELIINWVFSIFNGMQTLFYNDDVAISFQSLLIWTEADPYVGESSAEIIDSFANLSEIDGDVGGLFDKVGGLSGWLTGRLCLGAGGFFYTDAYVWDVPLPVYAWNIQCSVHEMGHMLESFHTHDCAWNGNNTAIDGCGPEAGAFSGCYGPIPYDEGGTIMSYCHLLLDVGIKLSNGFGPQPGALIRNTIAQAACLGTDCTDCINSVFSFTVTNPAVTSARVSWDDEAPGPWQVTYAALNGEFGEWQTVTNDFIVYEGLAPNSYYKFKIRPACATGESYLEREFIFGSGADWCGGDIFTDSGGLTGNYGNNEFLIRTITPAEGQQIAVALNTYDAQFAFERMYIFDGPTIESPKIDFTTWPYTFYPSQPDGSLTFLFISTEDTTFPGWDATVSCTALDTDTAVFDNFAYYPNPTKNSVTISSSDDLGEISIYNIAGQLLSTQKANGSRVVANISAFADGVYFFTVSNGSKVINFRIVKQE